MYFLMYPLTDTWVNCGDLQAWIVAKNTKRTTSAPSRP